MDNDSRHNLGNAKSLSIRSLIERWLIRAAVAGICLVALLIRLHGIVWDGGHLFHPDERFIFQVAGEIALPANWADALTPASTLNPFRSVGDTQRFPYGHIVVYLVRMAEPVFAPVARLFVDDTLIATGRLLAVIADTATVALTYLLGRRLYGAAAGLLASSVVALTVMHIQQAHFYTADVLLVPVILVALYALVALVDPNVDDTASYSLLAGAAFGIAVGLKASAVLLFVPVAAAHVLPALQQGTTWRKQLVRIWESSAWAWFGPAVLCAGAVFAMTNPYAILDWQQFARSLSAEAGMVRGRWIIPYTEQYRGTIPYLYPVLQQARWFLGPTLAVLVWGGTAWTLWHVVRGRGTQTETVLLTWVLPFTLLIGALFAKFPRYWLPVVPVMVVLGSGRLMDYVASPRLKFVVAGIILLPAALYAVAFSQIYSERHPWLQASEWLYRNVPAGATLVTERWDHSLPVPLTVDGKDRTPDEYVFVEVDSFTEPAALAAALHEVDAIVLSSPRVWQVVVDQERYHPRAAALYYDLLSGTTAFRNVRMWRVEPRIGAVSLRSNPFAQSGVPPPAAWQAAAPAPYTLTLGPADESFSVYDHPLTILLYK